MRLAVDFLGDLRGDLEGERDLDRGLFLDLDFDDFRGLTIF
jgi:hypothetical protein